MSLFLGVSCEEEAAGDGVLNCMDGWEISMSRPDVALLTYIHALCSIFSLETRTRKEKLFEITYGYLFHKSTVKGPRRKT
jgi:hypothetical protein